MKVILKILGVLNSMIPLNKMLSKVMDFIKLKLLVFKLKQAIRAIIINDTFTVVGDFRCDFPKFKLSKATKHRINNKCWNNNP